MYSYFFQIIKAWIEFKGFLSSCETPALMTLRTSLWACFSSISQITLLEILMISIIILSLRRFKVISWHYFFEFVESVCFTNLNNMSLVSIAMIYLKEYRSPCCSFSAWLSRLSFSNKSTRRKSLTCQRDKDSCVLIFLQHLINFGV